MRHPVVKWMEIGCDFDLTSMKLHEVQATIIWGPFLWRAIFYTYLVLLTNIYLHNSIH